MRLMMRAPDRAPVNSGDMDYVAQPANEMRDALSAIRDLANGGASATNLLRIARIALDSVPLEGDGAESEPAKPGASQPAQLLYRAWESPGRK
jgi:hypothetical protein